MHSCRWLSGVTLSRLDAEGDVTAGAVHQLSFRLVIERVLRLSVPDGPQLAGYLRLPWGP